jgi:hypothetical protein
MEKIALENNLSYVLGRKISLRNPEIRLLTPAMIKKAYYHRAHEFHPDKAASLGLSPEYLAGRFRNLQDSYTMILDSWNSGVFETLVNQQESPQPSQAAPRQYHQQKGVYHTGDIPLFPLRFAQYLYYSKKIDWNTLIGALSWQYAVRPKLGELGKKLGYLSSDDILLVLKNKAYNELFGDAALRMGVIDSRQLTVLLGSQRLMNLPIGKFFIEKGYLDNDELTSALKSFSYHNYSVRATRSRYSAAAKAAR